MVLKFGNKFKNNRSISLIDRFDSGVDSVYDEEETEPVCPYTFNKQYYWMRFL